VSLLQKKKDTNKAVISALLKEHENFEAIGLALDWKEAISIVKTMQADVLFINQKLVPNIEILEIISKDCPNNTQIVYISESESEAIQAIEFDFADYLLFPYTQDRFNKCIKKLTSRLNPQNLTVLDNIQHLIKQFVEPDKTLIIRDSGRIKFIDSSDIIWIGGAGNYVEIYLKNTKRPVLHRETLCAMESKLSCLGFIRIHRSILVRKKLISELKPTQNGDYEVTLRNGDKLNLSRRFKSAITGIF
jgi:two-component system LytT family response regulator